MVNYTTQITRIAMMIKFGLRLISPLQLLQFRQEYRSRLLQSAVQHLECIVVANTFQAMVKTTDFADRKLNLALHAS
jgi:hypothetical protein